MEVTSNKGSISKGEGEGLIAEYLVRECGGYFERTGPALRGIFSKRRRTLPTLSPSIPKPEEDELVMTPTSDPTLDAASLSLCTGKYSETSSFNIEGIDLNLDIDADGYVLQLGALSASF